MWSTLKQHSTPSRTPPSKSISPSSFSFPLNLVMGGLYPWTPATSHSCSGHSSGSQEISVDSPSHAYGEPLLRLEPYCWVYCTVCLSCCRELSPLVLPFLRFLIPGEVSRSCPNLCLLVPSCSFHLHMPTCLIRFIRLQSNHTHGQNQEVRSPFICLMLQELTALKLLLETCFSGFHPGQPSSNCPIPLSDPSLLLLMTVLFSFMRSCHR